MNIFGQKKPQEVLRENKRAIDRAIRDLDREKAKLVQSETKLIAEIKKAAKANQINACKIMAKDLVRTRTQQTKFVNMRAQLQGISLHLTTLSSTAAMAKAMTGATRAMRVMNRQVNLPAMQKIMMEFEKQTEMMEMKQEMMEDTMDDVLEGDNEEEESEAIVGQIFDEIGISLDTSMPEAAKGVKEGASAQSDADLMKRLESLRKE